MNSFKNVIAVLGLRRFSPILQRTQVAGGLLKNKKHKALKTRNINPLFGWRSARALAKALFTVVLSLNLCSVTLAQEDFGDPVIYANNTATVYGVVTINGQPAELGDVVGFFVGSELRFKGPVVVSGGKAYVTGLMNAAGGNEVFTFKVYDDSAKAVYPVPDISLTVGPGSTTGPTPLFEIKASSGPGLEDFGDPVIYANNTATVYGVVTINGQPAELGDVVGFFVGSELRFKGPVVVSGGKAYVTGLMNAAGGNEVFTFKVYDDSAKAVYPVPDISLTVGPGSTTGPTPLFEIKASSGPGLEEQLAQMTAARDAAIAERDARPTQATLDAAVVESRAAGQGDVTTDPAKYNLVTQASYDTVVAERDARPTQATLAAAVVESRAAGQGDVTTDPAKYNLVTQASYDTVVAERDARPTQATLDAVVVESRAAGQGDVTTDPAKYNLTTSETYDAVVAERDARFVDTDADGLTDIKETELETDPANETTFYLTGAYDDAVASAIVKGRGEVTSNPQNFDLISTSAYAAVEAERDARFADADGDGLTDLKETELQTNPAIETTFYLTGAYDDAVASAIVKGRGEVTSNPQNFNLISTAAFAALEAERDARFADTDGDGLTDAREAELQSSPTEETIFYLKSAYDAAVMSSRVIGRDEVITNPQNFSLISTTAYAELQAERDARFVDADGDGLTDVKEVELQTDPAIETTFYLTGAYDDAVASAIVKGRGEVTANPQNFDLISSTTYEAVVAERDANLVTYTSALADKDEAIATLNGSLTEK
ncbi:hypothetical protein N9B26_08120, partial [Akkermansiaceae bacterium]|nr:hypothetical protein [Akkermansiaceae bacterium]